MHEEPFSLEIFIPGLNFHSRLKISIPGLVILQPGRGSERKELSPLKISFRIESLIFSILPLEIEFLDPSGILNLWFGKPMVCVRVAFHENDGTHENDENDEDNSDSCKQGVECKIRGNHGNHENDENHGNPGCKPQVPLV